MLLRESATESIAGTRTDSNEFLAEVDFPSVVPILFKITIKAAAGDGKQIATLWWMTDRGDKFYPYYSQEFIVNLDGKTHTYKLVVPAEGSRLKGLQISGLSEVENLSFSDASIRSLTLDEI